MSDASVWASSLISIHALREEGDESPEDREEREAYFYPRPP